MEKMTETVEESMYTLMRHMDIGDRLMVPIANWDLARVYANELKSFGVKFKVNRMKTDNTKLDFVLVRRIE